LFEPEEQVLPRVETNRPACSTASCKVCNVNIAKHILAIENKRKVRGRPMSVNSTVWFPLSLPHREFHLRLHLRISLSASFEWFA
jgi:hypothetical protein